MWHHFYFLVCSFVINTWLFVFFMLCYIGKDVSTALWYFFFVNNILAYTAVIGTIFVLIHMHCIISKSFFVLQLLLVLFWYWRLFQDTNFAVLPRFIWVFLYWIEFVYILCCTMSCSFTDLTYSLSSKQPSIFTQVMTLKFTNMLLWNFYNIISLLFSSLDSGPSWC